MDQPKKQAVIVEWRGSDMEPLEKAVRRGVRGAIVEILLWILAISFVLGFFAGVLGL